MAKLFVMGGWLGNRIGGDVQPLWTPGFAVAFEEELEDIRRHGEHRRLLPGVPVPPSIRLTSDLQEAGEAEIVLMAVPSFAVGNPRPNCRGFCGMEPWW